MYGMGWHWTMGHNTCIDAAAKIVALIDRTSYQMSLDAKWGAFVGMQVWNDAPENGNSVDVAGITVTLVGLERVDHTWVSTSYAASVPPVEKDARREVRTVLETEPFILKLAPLEPGDRCQWYLRCVVLLLFQSQTHGVEQFVAWIPGVKEMSGWRGYKHASGWVGGFN
jgi:hypothetical protein